MTIIVLAHNIKTIILVSIAEEYSKYSYLIINNRGIVTFTVHFAVRVIHVRSQIVLMIQKHTIEHILLPRSS